ncbi:FtsB family cell division protein [Pseudochryseolinea flava]|uniref:Septum formation initiator family protein n=1 Tax=Pseudochryseolinea flava TaxID=2059302 RepID=A0A364XU14_9BACT|nr:septum formation initiator family protein [Pseudochryseolinea flava]RAV97656.1 septum formation initiator family protein [Pseudochryseolinea flava]
MFKKLPRPFQNFYVVVSVVFLLWMTFLDSNNLIARFQMSSKLSGLESEREYYQDKYKETEKDRNEVFGDRESIEKFAREKYLMKKETETIYVIKEKD